MKALSIRLKFSVVFCVFIVLLSYSIWLLATNSVKNSISYSFGSLEISQVEAIANQIDVELFAELNDPEDSRNAYYNTLRTFLDNKRIELGARYVYTMKLAAESEYIYIVEGLPASRTDAVALGEIVPLADMTPTWKAAFGGKPGYEFDYEEDLNIISIYCPLTDEDGKTVGILGIDYDATLPVKVIKSEVTKLSIFSAGICILTAILFEIVLTGFINRLNSIKGQIRNISEGNYDVRVLRFSGDEIGKLYMSFVDMVDELKKYHKTSTDLIKKNYDDLVNVFCETILSMTKVIELKDPFTAGHQIRVAMLCVAIADELALPQSQIQYLELAAHIHDIGKVSIPADILSKPGKLTSLEYELVKMHVQAGYDILKTVDFPWPIATIVYEHHERMNGSGYPDGRMGSELLLESRILAVADVVEAMLSYRPYRHALSVETALAEIRSNRGILYDASVTDACIRLFTEQSFAFDAPEDVQEQTQID